MKSKCTGLKFRFRSSNYFNEKTMSFEHKESITLLKRGSCKCEECTHAMVEIKETGSDLVDCVYWRKFTCTEDEEFRDGCTLKGKPKWDCFDEGCGLVEIDFFEAAR